MTFAEAVTRALELTGKANAARKIVEPAVAEIAAEALRLAKARRVDVSALLNGDAVHDRAVLNAAKVQGEIHADVNWAGVPALVLEGAVAIAKAAAALAVLL